MKELTENQKIWLAALRSGDYEQGTWRLNRDNKFCCLGVAAELFKTEETEIEEELLLDVKQVWYDGCMASAPDYVVDALKLLGPRADHIKDEVDLSLARYNDSGKTFAEIADIFEANSEDYTV